MRYTKNGSKKGLPDALLATTEDKEHHCVVKTVLPTDSFVLVGSSEFVRETKRGLDGRLKSIVLDTPSQSEKGLVGVVVRRIVPDTRCSCCDSEVHQDTVVYISISVNRDGRPKTQFSESHVVPLSGVSLAVSDQGYIDVSTSSGKFTTDFRTSRESRGEIWYVSPHKMFCFLARPSMDFLKEAGKSLYFERLAIRRDRLLKKLMEETYENDDRENEELRKRLEEMEQDFARLEDEMTALCREQDEAEEAHMQTEKAWSAERAKHLKVVESLELRLGEAEYHAGEYVRVTRVLRGIFSKKQKRILFDQLYETLGDFPELFGEEIDEET